MARSSRRNFLRTSVAGGAGVGLSYFVGNQSLGRGLSKSPNEQPVLGFIGCGIRYHNIVRPAMEYGPAAALCDVDMLQLGRAKQVVFETNVELDRPLDVRTYEDYRHVLDRDDVDAVVIATPDHWHSKIAVEALQAGKDVYCEKPLTLTIREGQQILKALDQTDRIMQVGTQQRTEMDKRFAKAAALVRGGRIGKVKRVTTAIGGSLECDALPKTAAPKVLNWDLWLGQTPLVDYRQGDKIHAMGYGAGFPYSRTHNYFRWWYEYSGGKLTDWGAHHVDVAMWALDLVDGPIGVIEIEPESVNHPVPFDDHGMPTQDDRFNAAVSFNVKVTLPGGIEMRVRDTADDLGFENGIMFEGEEGRFFVNRGKLTGRPVEQLEEDPLPEDALTKLYGRQPPSSHFDDFFGCMKTRDTPVSDVASHHRAISLCHAVNIAMRLDRKLQFDTDSEQFIGDSAANGLVGREQRKGYEINV
ncbi:MAG: Gfo/Idh/MocA family oxidoreductase [Planctomycetota bacterium]